ncbi:DUF7511 domain-containing protein [Halobellus captivus]|uniref:DUF7511 domain-containing protein n=1 Tax=Halobellus captivus TaxID=2592614 RepID=UPI001EF0A87D|nr:hypothetical protein [Halobellus captivus]
MPIDTDLPTDSPPTDDRTAADARVGDIDTDDRGRADGRGDTDDREQILVARVEAYEGDADECTIYPVEADPATLQTTWISAEAGSFVALDSMR